MLVTQAQAASAHFKVLHELLTYLNACVQVADWERALEGDLKTYYCGVAVDKTPEPLMTEEDEEAEDEATAKENDELWEWYDKERCAAELMYIVRDAEKTPPENMMQYLGDITREMGAEPLNTIEEGLIGSTDKDALKNLLSSTVEKASWLSQLGELRTYAQLEEEAINRDAEQRQQATKSST